MTRRYESPYDGKQYLVDQSTGQIHDLDHEDTSENGCKIDKIAIADVLMLDNESEVIIHVSSLWDDYLGCTKCLNKYSKHEE